MTHAHRSLVYAVLWTVALMTIAGGVLFEVSLGSHWDPQGVALVLYVVGSALVVSTELFHGLAVRRARRLALRRARLWGVRLEEL